MKRRYFKKALFLFVLPFFLVIAFSESLASRSVMVTGTDIISTIAGRPPRAGYYGNGISARKSLLNKPHRVFVYKNYVYIADTINHAIRRFTVGGKIETIAGGRGMGYSGDGGPAVKAKLSIPTSVYVDDYYVYFCEFGNNSIRRFKIGGNIETIAGGRGAGKPRNGALARKSRFNKPHSVFVKKEYVYVADTLNHGVLRFKVGGRIEILAGFRGRGYTGDKGKAKYAKMSEPVSIFVTDNFVYVAEYANSAIRRINLISGIINTVAGGRGFGYSGDNGSALKARLRCPHSVCVYKGYVYISDMNNHAVRRFRVDGNIETIAGGNGRGYLGDGISARKAKFNTPPDLYVYKGYVYVAEYGNNCIRRFKVID
jgi:hypothetical protein